MFKPANYLAWSAVSTMLAFVLGALLWWGGTDLSVFEVFVALVGVATLFYLVVTKSIRDLLPNELRDYIILVFLILSLGQWLYSDTVAWLFLAVTVYLIALYWLFKYWKAKSEAILMMFVQGYLFGALVMSALCILNYLFAALSIDLQWFPYELRWRGFLDDPVVYGALLVPSIIIFGYQAICTERESDYWRYTLFTLVIFISLILTGSRGAWLNLVFASFILSFLDRSVWSGQKFSRAFIISVAAFVLALALIYVVPLNGRTYHSATLENRFSASDGPRIENFQAAPEYLFKRPPLEIVFGSGSGSYELFSDGGFSAHNTYLRLLFEHGVAGFVLFSIFLYWSIRMAWRQNVDSKTRATLLIAIIGGILIQSFFVDTLHWRHLWLILAFI